MKGPLDIHRDLLAAGVPHEIVRLPRAITGADELPDVLELPARSCVSVRMYDADGELYALAVPASAPTRPTTLARALGVPAIRPAAVDHVNIVTDFSAALVSPICLPPEVHLVFDAALGAADVLYAPTGDSGTVLKMRSRDLLLHTAARVTALTVPSAAHRPAAAAPALRLVEQRSPVSV